MGRQDGPRPAVFKAMDKVEDLVPMGNLFQKINEVRDRDVLFRQGKTLPEEVDGRSLYSVYPG